MWKYCWRGFIWKARLFIERNKYYHVKVLPKMVYITEFENNYFNSQQSHCWSPLHLQTKHQIDWDSATCITYSTDCYQRLTLESWFTNLEQTPLNRSQQLPVPLLRDSSKTNRERMARQNDIFAYTIIDCLTVAMDGWKRTNDITSLHSQ